MDGAPPMHPQERLYRLLAGKWVTAAIAAAAELGLADVLVGGPLLPAQLATKLECDADALMRLLRVLGGEELVELDREGRIALTPTGHELREGRLRELARYVGTPFMWTPWSRLAEAVRSPEKTAFDRALGAPLFEYLDQEAEAAALYHRAVDAFTRREAQALAAMHDFSGVKTVVDVGGGLGALLHELGQRFPTIEELVLFDRPAVIERVEKGPLPQQLGERLVLAPGDFFAGMPVDADVFVLKHVLHNWEDEQCLSMLRHCAARLRPGGQLLIVEGILLPGLRRDRVALLDLEMFVLCGEGRERTKPEFRNLLSKAGLRLHSTQDLAGTTRLLVATRR